MALVRPTPPVTQVVPLGAVLGHLFADSAESSTATKLRVQALDSRRIETGDRHRAECGAHGPTDVARVLMPGLRLDVEVGQPPVARVAEGDAAARSRRSSFSARNWVSSLSTSRSVAAVPVSSTRSPVTGSAPT
jgi:hypothetical protein